MEPDEVAHVIRDASGNALECYLRMCGLDSPWEVPEAFLATEAAKALAGEGLRIAVEFRLDRCGDHPRVPESEQIPERLRGAYALLDVAILKKQEQEPDPWALTLDGIVEFKKHSSLEADASLIDFMIKEKRATYGVLALLVVGSSEERVTDEAKRLTAPLIGNVGWRQLAEAPSPKKYPPLSNTNVHDRWWDISCLVKP